MKVPTDRPAFEVSSAIFASVLSILLFASVPATAEGPVNLDFHGAEIRNVLRLLAEKGRMSIVVDEEVTGTVTLRLRNVTVKDALDVVLQSKQLGMERVGGIVRVARQQRLAEEKEQKAGAAKATQAAAPLVTRIIPVNYASAQELAPQVKALLTERGTVTVDVRTNSLIITDVAP